MRIFFLTIVLAFVSTGSFCQSSIVLSQRNSYRINDQIRKKPLDLTGMDLKAVHLQINIADLLSSSRDISQSIMPAPDSSSQMMSIERRKRQYFNITNKGMELLGEEDALHKCTFNNAEKWLPFPLHEKDSVCGTFSGIGIYCHKIPYRKFGVYNTKVVGTDCIVSTNGDTLNHVHRVQTSRRYLIQHLSSSATSIEALPPYTPDSISKLLNTAEKFVTEEQYRWFLDGYRYPIIEHITIRNYDGKINTTYTYYTPTEEQSQLEDDENETWRKELQEQQKEKTTKAQELCYKLTHDASSSSVTIKYNLPQPARLSFILSDTKGIIYKRIEEDSDMGENSVSINYSALPYGQCILYIYYKGKEFTEKFNHK